MYTIKLGTDCYAAASAVSVACIKGSSTLLQLWFSSCLEHPQQEAKDEDANGNVTLESTEALFLGLSHMTFCKQSTIIFVSKQLITVNKELMSL